MGFHEIGDKMNRKYVAIPKLCKERDKSIWKCLSDGLAEFPSEGGGKRITYEYALNEKG